MSCVDADVGSVTVLLCWHESAMAPVLGYDRTAADAEMSSAAAYPSRASIEFRFSTRSGGRGMWVRSEMVWTTPRVRADGCIASVQ